MVRTETLERILTAAFELGYTTNVTARTLKTSVSRAVGVVVPDLTNPIFAQIVRGVEDVFDRFGYSTWIANTDDVAARSEEAVTAFQQRSVDGLVLATARLDDPLVARLRDGASRTPFVLVNRRSEDPAVRSVGADVFAAIRLAVDHLVELGHRRIALLAGPQDTSTGLHSMQAFVDAVDGHGLPRFRDQFTECSAFSIHAGFDATRAALRHASPFTAVVAANDFIMLGCLDALAQARLRCPEDVSVVGGNDMLFADRISPGLTTVRIPFYEMGVAAARILERSMHGEPDPESSVALQPSLVVRGSTAAPPGRAGR